MEVTQTIEDFKLKPFDNAKAFALFQELEFKTLVREFAEKMDAPEKNYQMITRATELENLVQTLRSAEMFAIDTETTSIHPMNADLVGISLSCRADTGFYIPLGHTEDILQIEKPDVLRILGPVLADPEQRKVGQNIKYDMIVLARYGMPLNGVVFDSMIASYLLNPTRRGHGLDQIALDLFGYKMVAYDEVTGKGKDQIGFQEVPAKDALFYAAEDADLTFMACGRFSELLAEQGLSDLMAEIEVPLIPVLADMEMTGFRVDKAALARLSETFETEMNQLEQEIYDLAGETFNINSSQQLGVVLFEKLGLKSVKKTRKKPDIPQMSRC